MKESVAVELVNKFNECFSKLEETYSIINCIENDQERDQLQKAVIDVQLKKLKSLIDFVCYQYPLLFPWKTLPKEEDKELMDQVAFSLSSPWHGNAYQFFGFMCNNCKIKITQDDIEIAKDGKQIYEFCVAITNEAQKRGWTHKGQFSFFCPKCS